MPGPLVDRIDELTLNVVYQKSKGYGLDFGVFHSKLMLIEFKDKLRVVVSSANLYEHDWLYMSNVIWFQDFPRISVLSKQKEPTSFLTHLLEFLQLVTPCEGCFRQEINLCQFDFTDAQVELVASVNGRYQSSHKGMKQGMWRLQQLCNPSKPSPFQPKGPQKLLVFCTSSIGVCTTILP